jgi:Leucine-rich repeat (LRR) protein
VEDIKQLNRLSIFSIKYNSLRQLPDLDVLINLEELDVSYNPLEQIPRLNKKIKSVNFSKTKIILVPE